MIQPKFAPLAVIQHFCDEYPDIFNSLVQYLQYPGYGGFTIYSESGRLTHAEQRNQIKGKSAKP
jgi:hypothetical protein